MIDPDKIASCARRFVAESGLIAVWLFGSALTDRLRPDSDVDFALYYEPKQQPDRRSLGRLAADLEAILGRPADLGCLNSLNLIYANQAFRTGRLIYAADPQAALAYAVRLHSLYLDLKQDRRVVEEAYGG